MVGEGSADIQLCGHWSGELIIILWQWMDHMTGLGVTYQVGLISLTVKDLSFSMT